MHGTGIYNQSAGFSLELQACHDISCVVAYIHQAKWNQGEHQMEHQGDALASMSVSVTLERCN